jgi:hypothetical protein
MITGLQVEEFQTFSDHHENRYYSNLWITHASGSANNVVKTGRSVNDNN